MQQKDTELKKSRDEIAALNMEIDKVSICIHTYIMITVIIGCVFMYIIMCM